MELPPLEIPDEANKDDDDEEEEDEDEKKLTKPLQLWVNIPYFINAYCGNED